MKFRPGLVAIAACIVGMWAFPVCAQVNAQSNSDLYDLAAREGELVYYAQGPRQVYADLVAQFEATYPKVKVRIVPGRYDVIAKIDNQLKSGGALDADVVTAQTIQDLVRWDRSGVLMPFEPTGVETVPAHLRRKGFFPLSVYVVGSAYNAEKISDSDAPRSINDFLKPKFREKIVSTYPHDDDVTLYLYDQIRKKYGLSFFSDLMKQNPQFVRSHVLVANALKTGTHVVTFDQITTFNSSNFVVPTDVPIIVFPYGIAAFAAAKHPDAAKLFLSFSLSKEQQERYVKRRTWSARQDVGPPEGFKPLASYQPADDFINFISDQKYVESLRAEFEKIIGPVKGEYISAAPGKK